MKLSTRRSRDAAFEQLLTQVPGDLDRVIVTDALVARGATSAGGWSAKQLRILGVSWPPQKGWRLRVQGRSITREQADAFVELSKNKKQAERDQAFVEVIENGPLA